eukprot:2170052-Rhodomonas_salina.2
MQSISRLLHVPRHAGISQHRACHASKASHSFTEPSRDCPGMPPHGPISATPRIMTRIVTRKIRT